MKKKLGVFFLALVLMFSMVMPIEAVAVIKPQISASSSHYMWLDSKGVLWVWGNNDVGQVGNGKTGGFVEKPYKIGSGYTAIAAGNGCSYAIKGTTLYAWGRNYQGKLGDGTITDKNKPVKIGTGFTAIAAGMHHTLALKGKDLYAWGWNYRGCLGNAKEAKARP